MSSVAHARGSSLDRPRLAHHRFLALLLASGILTGCGGAAGQSTNDPSLGTTPPDRSTPAPVTVTSMTSGSIPESAAAMLASDSAPVSGAAVYATCAACHQSTGLGLPGAFPPLAGSEWLNGKPDVPIRIVLDGLGGPIVVRGQSFAAAMQPWGAAFSDAQVAAVLTYERSSWGNHSSAVTAAQVAAVRAATAARTTPWTADELKAFR